MEMEKERAEMVQTQLRARDIVDERVLMALFQAPRHQFLPPELWSKAYSDGALHIGEGQTISQPYVVAYMTQALQLKPTDSVLEIGTGSGYAAAVLGHIVREVVTIERHRSLAQQAHNRLTKLGYKNVRVLYGDGTWGWPQKAPFDAILAAAGGPEVPVTWLEQLAVGGRLVMPVGSEPRKQTLVRVCRPSLTEYSRETLLPVRFVPLIGKAGWSEDAAER